MANRKNETSLYENWGDFIVLSAYEQTPDTDLSEFWVAGLVRDVNFNAEEIAYWCTVTETLHKLTDYGVPQTLVALDQQIFRKSLSNDPKESKTHPFDQGLDLGAYSSKTASFSRTKRLPRLPRGACPNTQ